MTNKNIKTLINFIENNKTKLDLLPINKIQIEYTIESEHEKEYLIFFEDKSAYLIGNIIKSEEDDNEENYYCLDYYQEKNVNSINVLNRLKTIIFKNKYKIIKIHKNDTIR